MIKDFVIAAHEVRILTVLSFFSCFRYKNELENARQ